MDARRHKPETDDEPGERRLNLFEGITAKRDRLLASLTLLGGIGLVVGLPFALRAGAEFFMPVTAALVVAIALVPLLEWFERRGVPAKASAGLCVIIFLTLMIFALGSIVIPASDWVHQVPSKIPKVRTALEPVLDIYKNFDRFISRTVAQMAVSSEQTRSVRIETPNSMLLAHQLGAAFAHPALLRAAGDFLFPVRLDRDAQAHDRQPRQLRRRADDGAGDPAGGRCHLDLSRHDHPHQYRARAR